MTARAPNPDARTVPVEVLFSPNELDRLDRICAEVGLKRAPLLRTSGLAFPHGSGNSHKKESPKCRGMRPASRAMAAVRPHPRF